MILTAIMAAWGYIGWSAYFYLKYRARAVKGNVILITGGGSGIGRLMALKFATLGAKLVLWDVNEAGLEKVKAEVIAAGAECDTYKIDITDRELVYATAKKVGKVDILINNAGIVTGKTILDCPDHLMQKTIDVNTTAHFWTIKAFLPEMIAADSGHIVTVSSMAGIVGVGGMVDYCASKFGAYGIHDSLSMELRLRKSKVRTTLVCPFYINTGMFDGVRTGLFPLLEENWVANRIVKAIRRGEEVLCMPWIMGIMPMFRCLPSPWFAWLVTVTGANSSMSDFKGRQPIAAAPAASAETQKSK